MLMAFSLVDLTDIVWVVWKDGIWGVGEVDRSEMSRVA